METPLLETVGSLHGPLCMTAYFTTLAAALWLVARDVASTWGAKAPGLPKWLLCSSSAGAVGVTWWYILRWLAADVERYESFALWVRDSDLIVQAYRLVVLSPAHWFWSSQLMAFVVPWVGFVSATCHGKPLATTLAYVWLGFAGAISASLPLHLAACGGTFLSSSAAPLVGGAGTAEVWAVVAVTVAGVVALPLTLSGPAFGWVLGLIHAVPLLLPLAVKRSGGALPRAALWALGAAALALHATNAAAVAEHVGTADPAAVGRALWKAAGSNLCQTSITFDLLFVSVITAAAALIAPKRSAADTMRCLLAVAAMPIVSPGAAFAFLVATN